MLKFIILLLAATLCHCQERDLDSIIKRLEYLERHLAEAKEEIKSQDEVIRRVAQQYHQQDVVINSLVQDTKDHAEQLAENESEIAEIKDTPVTMSAPIAFTAYATAPRDYLEGDTVQFEGTITNRGLNYNTATSVFTAPHDGLYFFTTSLYALESDAVAADIMRNQDILVQAFAPDTVQRDHATAVVMVECNVGDEIYVRVTEDDGPLEGSTDALTTFSGAMIAEL